MKDFECILGDSEFLDGQLLWYLRPLCAAHVGQQGTHGQTAFNRNSVYNTLRIVYKKDIKIMDVTSSYL